MGVHATIPFYVDMVRAMLIPVQGIDMVITAEQSTEIQCAVAIALQEVLVIASRNHVETSEMTNLGKLADELVLSARNGVESHSRVSVRNVERLAMVLQTYQTDPDLLIEEVRNSVLNNNLVISTGNGAEIHPTVRIDEARNDLVLTVANGIEIPVMKALENINNSIELNVSKRIMKIKHWDPALLGDADDWKLNRKVDMPFELALDMGIIADDSGKMNLVLYANDDVGTILTHPMIIGTLDPKKLSELDPYFVPDSTSE